MTIMVLNKDPKNSAQVTFNLSGFNASTYMAYTLASTASSAISASSSAAWSATQSFAPYSITLLVINGSESLQTRIGVVPQPRRPDDSRLGHGNPASGDQRAAAPP